RSPWIIAGTMTMMGLFLWVADRGGQKSDSVEHVGTTRAILIGCSQAFAIIPGVSRSGVTITTGLLLGLQRTAAVQFSFFMSMPIIFGAVVLKSHYLFSSLGQPGVALAVIASAVSGLAAIHVLMTYVKTRSFAPFVVYRLALGLGLFAYLLARK
ncbi:MAG: undecaprenyl-diphosphate phosphatase, partial [Elusimicrobia bacterium]|nr:undecaprenyl-diphosphate phosphatase [Elusimicrobiota bacterium]